MKPRPLTRRQFVTAVGVTAGGAAAYTAMRGLDLFGDEAGTFTVGPPRLGGRVSNKKVIIVGAGLAGMCAAYELGKVGYDCQILEARTRTGGRCWSVRDGSDHTELSGERQVAEFGGDQYFNPGPARIPQHHHTTLGYCRELGVAVEVFTNVNEAAFYYRGRGALGGEKVRVREAKTDMRGYVAELMTKTIDTSLLDQPLTATNKAALLSYLDREGDLENGTYNGSDRRGFMVLPGAGDQAGVVADPHGFDDLLRSQHPAFFSDEYAIHQQMTMLQVVGGTDKLAAAFDARLSDRIELGAEVSEIRETGFGVRVAYTDARGETRDATGDYCICTLPLPVLRGVTTDLPSHVSSAIDDVYYVPSGKIGLHFSRRFWEDDDGIFGGITRTNSSIRQIWYPSSGYLGPDGVLIGYYNFDQAARAMGELPHAEREAEALRQGSAIHPQYDNAFMSSYSVSWQELPYSLGAFAHYDDSTRRNAYALLSRTSGRIRLAGEHLSHLTGWMAGAFESALTTIDSIHTQVLAEDAQ